MCLKQICLEQTHTHTHADPTYNVCHLPFRRGFMHPTADWLLCSSCLNGHVFLFGSRGCSHLLIPAPSSSCSVPVRTFSHTCLGSLCGFGPCVCPLFILPLPCLSAVVPLPSSLCMLSLFHSLKDVLRYIWDRVSSAFPRRCQWAADKRTARATCCRARREQNRFILIRVTVSVYDLQNIKIYH